MTGLPGDFEISPSIEDEGYGIRPLVGSQAVMTRVLFFAGVNPITAFSSAKSLRAEAAKG
jgi:hypothetical protein